MNRERVRNLLSLSWNDEQRKYNYGMIEQEDHDAYRFLWHRLQYRLGDIDTRGSWLLRTFNRVGYEGTMTRINRVRAFWGFEALKV